MTANFPNREWVQGQSDKAARIVALIDEAKRKQALLTRMTVESVTDDLEETPDAPDDDVPTPENDVVRENDPVIEGDTKPDVAGE